MQAPLVIDDGTGLDVLNAINAAIAALNSSNSGAGAPSPTSAYMLWVDSGNGVMLRRNSANSAWVLAGSAIANITDTKSGAYTFAKSDYQRFIRFTGGGGFTAAFTAAATLTEGWWVELKNDSSGNVTLDPSGSELIDGTTTVTLGPGKSCRVWCSGTAFATTVSDADPNTALTSVPQTFTAGQRGEVTALTDVATITLDMNDSNFFSVTLAGNRTLANPSNLAPGQSGSVFIAQDGTGSRTLAYGAYWDFEGGSAPMLSTAGGTVDRLDYVVRSTTSIHASLKKAWS